MSSLRGWRIQKERGSGMLKDLKSGQKVGFVSVLLRTIGANVSLPRFGRLCSWV